ncbi:elongin-B-like [Cebus imitator]|uniref:elongin-B-like n=1 Tax=Cebus imitator TaxID=2715852 RepID=UPI0018978856|nr:elongin-B-like [Cebus imitator]
MQVTTETKGHSSHSSRGLGFTLTPAHHPQDIFLMIWCHKTTIFTDAKESSRMFKMKRNVKGILKWLPEEQWLYKDDQLLDDGKTLGECDFTSQTAWPQAPATAGLAFQVDDTFGGLCIELFYSPPKLPNAMKPQDLGSSANEQAVQ